MVHKPVTNVSTTKISPVKLKWLKDSGGKKNRMSSSALREWLKLLLLPPSPHLLPHKQVWFVCLFVVLI